MKQRDEPYTDAQISTAQAIVIMLFLFCTLAIGAGLWLFTWIMSEIVAASQAGWWWMV